MQVRSRKASFNVYESATAAGAMARWVGLLAVAVLLAGCGESNRQQSSRSEAQTDNKAQSLEKATSHNTGRGNPSAPLAPAQPTAGRVAAKTTPEEDERYAVVPVPAGAALAIPALVVPALAGSPRISRQPRTRIRPIGSSSPVLPRQSTTATRCATVHRPQLPGRLKTRRRPLRPLPADRFLPYPTDRRPNHRARS